MRLGELLPRETLNSSQREKEIARVSSFADADILSVVFATDAGALRQALTSGAGIILAPVSMRHRTDLFTSSLDSVADMTAFALGHDERVVFVADPRFTFSVVGSGLRGRPAGGIHPTAVIGQRVQVGSSCSIGPGAVLEDGVSLGECCEIGPRVTIHAGTRLGNRVVVQAGAVLGATGFGYARNSATGEYLLFPQQGTLVVEDDVEIGANTTIDRGALGETRIGSGTKIDNLVHIGHNCVIGRNVIIAAQTGISGSSVVEDGAILGGQVGIGEHAKVGKGVILGGGAGVLSGKKMRGEGKVFWGRPARPLQEYLRDLARLRRK